MMPLSPIALENRREYNRRYRAEHRDEARETLRRWQRTPIGRLKNNLYVVRHRLKHKPTETLRETEAFLLAEIARLRGDA